MRCAVEESRVKETLLYLVVRVGQTNEPKKFGEEVNPQTVNSESI